jgi:hypothetical protein
MITCEVENHSNAHSRTSNDETQQCTSDRYGCEVLDDVAGHFFLL